MRLDFLFELINLQGLKLLSLFNILLLTDIISNGIFSNGLDAIGEDYKIIPALMVSCIVCYVLLCSIEVCLRYCLQYIGIMKIPLYMVKKNSLTPEHGKNLLEEKAVLFNSVFLSILEMIIPGNTLFSYIQQNLNEFNIWGISTATVFMIIFSFILSIIYLRF